jgi:predicted RNA-binding Zn-ribbon protein involved in translation (DUF1610 family)
MAIMKVSIEQIMVAVEQDDNIGICTACGEEATGVEPDAEHYECEGCGKNEVFGAEQLLLMYL